MRLTFDWIRSNWFALLIIFFISIYVLAAVSVSLNRYWQFDAFWYELGLYNTAIYKVAHFKAPIIEQFGNKLIFADHFNPSLFLFSPIYWFTDRTETILIAQAVAVGASAWVAYLITRKKVADKLVVFALVFAYMGYVGLQNALYTDFHDTTVATLFVILTFWAIFNRRWGLYWTFLILGLGFKENMAGFGVGLGAFLILMSERKVRIGVLTIVASVVYYLIVTGIVIPYFSGGAFSYSPILVSHDPIIVAKSFFEPAVKVKTIFFSLLTFGFAPVFALSIWPMLLEHFGERFMLSQAGTRWDLGFHYNALLSPILFVGSLPFVAILIKHGKIFVRAWAILVILTVVFLHRFYLHGPLLLAHHPVFYEQTRRNSFVDDFFKKIPKEGLIMTSNNIGAHLSDEQVVLIDLNKFENLKPDVVALDLREGQNANNFFPASFEQAQDLVNVLIFNPEYVRLNTGVDSQFIYEKKYLLDKQG